MHISPYCHIWDCTSGLDSRMIVIERAFESSNIILIDEETLGNVRTHPEELHVVKRKFYLKFCEFNSVFYF